MLVYPQVGATVQVWYKRQLADWFPLHGKIGTVLVVAKGKGPRNHGILIDGKLWVVPCGNLRNVPQEDVSADRDTGHRRPADQLIDRLQTLIIDGATLTAQTPSGDVYRTPAGKCFTVVDGVPIPMADERSGSHNGDSSKASAHD